MIRKWIRFRWELDSTFDAGTPELPPFVVRDASPAESDAVARTLKAAYSQDSAWSTAGMRSVEQALDLKCERAFAGEPPSCVVVLHGTRIIGASLLAVEPDAENHLVSGPCVLNEYRSRGLGSILLFSSLQFLRKSGLNLAVGVVPAISTAARYVYPKFGGQAEEIASKSSPDQEVAA